MRKTQQIEEQKYTTEFDCNHKHKQLDRIRQTTRSDNSNVFKSDLSRVSLLAEQNRSADEN